jgi:hypothetical protein
MLPPAHVRLRTIPREELDLWGVGKRTRAKSNSFTMRGFSALLLGPSDIQVRAPGISWPIFVEVFEGILNVHLKLSSKGKCQLFELRRQLPLGLLKGCFAVNGFSTVYVHHDTIGNPCWRLVLDHGVFKCTILMGLFNRSSHADLRGREFHDAATIHETMM